MSRVSSHNTHDICTDLENILDRICPLRTLEMASPQAPLVVGPFTARLIHKRLRAIF